MDTETLQLGASIALLMKYYPDSHVPESILKGVNLAKQLFVLEAIDREAGGEPVLEDPIIEFGTGATDGAGTYYEIAKWSVTKGKVGILNKIELATSDYVNTQFQVTINGKKKLTNQALPNATTFTFPDVQIRGGQEILIEAKDTDSSANTVWGDITGKEIAV